MLSLPKHRFCHTSVDLAAGWVDDHSVSYLLSGNKSRQSYLKLKKGVDIFYPLFGLFGLIFLRSAGWFDMAVFLGKITYDRQLEFFTLVCPVHTYDPQDKKSNV
jgi:hypothetical protein